MFVTHLAIPSGLLAGIGLLLLATAGALAHCDTMSGPVVEEARAALAGGDLTPVLKWVKPEAEAEVRAAFKQAGVVRAKGKDAQELADRHFFETLVRVHRAGEGAPYTGLKDEPVEPIVARTDQALADGSVDEVVGLLAAALERGIRARFEKTTAAGARRDESVTLGREYVEAYVEFTHYIERLHRDIKAEADHAHGH